MDRNQAEELAINVIKNLTQSDFNLLGNMIRNEEWTYVGSMSTNCGDEASWMRFKNEQFEIISSQSYGEHYFLVHETTMDLDTLKNVVDSVMGFGDGTSGGSKNANIELDLAAIIESIAFSLPGHGGNNDTILNEDLQETMDTENIDFETAINRAFFKVASNYDIPFSL
jgi:hypothetical protein